MIINHTFNIWVHFASSGFQNTYIILHPLQQIKAKCTLSLSIFVATHFRLQCEVIISYRFISVIYIYHSIPVYPHHHYIPMISWPIIFPCFQHFFRTQVPDGWDPAAHVLQEFVAPPTAPQLPVASKHEPGVNETYFDTAECEASEGSEDDLNPHRYIVW